MYCLLYPLLYPLKPVILNAEYSVGILQLLQ